MSTNHHTPTRFAGPECGQFAALLSLLDEPGIDPDEAARARAHAGACAHCRAHLLAYGRLDGALRAHAGLAATPPLRTADLLWSVTGIPAEEIMDIKDEHVEAAAPDTTMHGTNAAPVSAPPPAMLNDQRQPRPGAPRRRMLSLAAALAAVLVIGALAQLLLNGRWIGARTAAQTHAQSTATALASHSSDFTINDVVMVSATEGWAAGANTLDGFSATDAPGVLWHFDGNAWARYPLDDSCGCIFELRTLSVVSPIEIWAAGDGGTLLRYDGHTWQRLPGNAPNIGRLAMVSATHGWGLLRTGQVLEYRSGAWTAVALPAVPGLGSDYTVTIQSLHMRSDDEGWMVGQAFIPSGSPQIAPQGVIFHDVAGHWQLAYTLANASPTDIAMVSASEGWVDGDIQRTVTTPASPGIPSATDTYPAPLLLHFVNGSWQRAADPVVDFYFQQSGLGSLLMLSPQDGWALATSSSTLIYQPGTAADSYALLHYHGGQWTEVRLPLIAGRDSIDIAGMSGTPDGGIWVVGSSNWRVPAAGTAPDGSPYTVHSAPLMLHELNGVWTVVAS